MLKILSAALVALSLATCEKDGTNAADPFSNGSSLRNEIVVISDLHMGADLSYAELNTNLAPLKLFLEKIRESPNVKELVIDGDLADEWFVPADINTYNGKDQTDFISRMAVSNKEVLDAFTSIIKEGKIKLTYVPGNHDLTITAENIDRLLPGINQARDPEQGLGTYTPDDLPQLAIEHGHRYNFFCAPDMLSNQDVAPGTILPPGYFFTRIAALHISQNCKQNLDSVPVITKNSSGDPSQDLLYFYYQTWKWALEFLPVNNRFSEKMIVTGVNGFTGTFSVNDLLPRQEKAGGEIDVTLFKGIQDSWEERQTRNRVPVHIPAARAIANASSLDETDEQAVIQYFSNPESGKRIVVFGHNHRAAIIPSYNKSGQKCIYANSGTWIDTDPDGPTATCTVISLPADNSVSLTKVENYSFLNGEFTLLSMDTLSL